jgi:ABC-2 type transport system ATP-binding protein
VCSAKSPIITVQKVHAGYGSKVALRDVSFQVVEGEVFGILGRNGAGKTTVLSLLEGLQRPKQGIVLLWGRAPWRLGAGPRRRIGAQMDTPSLPPRLTVLETLRFFRGIAGKGRTLVELVTQLGLEHCVGTLTDELSTGQRRRLSFALAILTAPDLLLLDEPSLGLDPEGSRCLERWVADERDKGCTIVIATNSMSEAQRWCDRVLFLDDGGVRACGTPAQVIRDHVPMRRFEVTPRAGRADSLDGLALFSGVKDTKWQENHLLLITSEPENTERMIVEWQMRNPDVIQEIVEQQATLEDVFFAIAANRPS